MNKLSARALQPKGRTFRYLFDIFFIKKGTHRGAPAKPPPPCGARPKAVAPFLMKKISKRYRKVLPSGWRARADNFFIYV